MIQLAPQMRILVAIEPADFRKGIDGLARLARDELSPVERRSHQNKLNDTNDPPGKIRPLLSVLLKTSY